NILDFRAETGDFEKNWKIELIFILDYTPDEIAIHYAGYQKLVNEILIDAENYYKLHLNSVVTDASLDNFLSVNYIKFNRQTNNCSVTQTGYNYFDLKAFNDQITPLGIYQSIPFGEDLMQHILDTVVQINSRNNCESNKFGVYCMKSVSDEVSIKE